MASATMTFAASNLFPLRSSMFIDRPHMSICRMQQKKKKPQFSKLSILTKTSNNSTKVNSYEYKKNKRENSQYSKNMNKKLIIQSIESKNKKKTRSNSCKHNTIKAQKLGLSCEPEDFSKLWRQTPMSRTVSKGQEVSSVSPLYSSLVFNSLQQSIAPDDKNKDLAQILSRTSKLLMVYKQTCSTLKKQRDYYKKKYSHAKSKMANKVKKA